MGRAGGGGGGMHSSGGHSSSRSSGGHSVSSSRAGSSFSGSHRAGSGMSHSFDSFSGGGSRHSSPPPRRDHGSSRGPEPRPPRRTNYSHSIYCNEPRVFSTDSRLSSKLLRTLGRCVLVIILLVIICTAVKTVNITIPSSTHNREKLTDVSAFDSNCIVDELSWFDNVNSAGKKLKDFYTDTGIQPYIYLKSYDSSLTSNDAKEEYATELFDSLGLSENTFLYVYFAERNQDSDVGYMCYVNGKMVDSIMDDEAIDIFWAYIDKYWYSNLSTDEMFEKVFSYTSAKIMKHATSFTDVLKYLIIAIAVTVGLVLLLVIMNTKRKHEAAKAEETERILKASMSDLVNSGGADSLLNKYDK
jgi:large-conductance mechanosensitive channel